MSEYQHEDKKEYLIAESSRWRIWNNGIVESLFGREWREENSNYTRVQRLQFLKLWENGEINGEYHFNCWHVPPTITHYSSNGAVTFSGFKEQCPECKQLTMIWENKIQLCKGCEYIHAFMVDDDN